MSQPTGFKQKVEKIFLNNWNSLITICKILDEPFIGWLKMQIQITRRNIKLNKIQSNRNYSI